MMPASNMIRAMGSEQEDFEVFFPNNVVAVGWSGVNFTTFGSPDKLVRAVEDAYYSDGSTAPQVVGKKKTRYAGSRESKKGTGSSFPFGAVSGSRSRVAKRSSASRMVSCGT
jgi:hypothetical protein